MHYLRKALTNCEYPKWALNKVERKFLYNQENSNTQEKNSEEVNKNPSNNTKGRDP